MSVAILPGAEARSYPGGPLGVLCLHGFTGSPTSVLPLAEAFAAAGHSVEVPLLPGHGTTIEDMIATGFADWSAAATDAFERLAARSAAVAVAGLSMGGLLAAWLAVERDDVAALICINPLTVAPEEEILEMARGMLDEGTEVLPGGSSDIAKPDAVEVSYRGTPLRPLLDMIDNGVVPLTGRLDRITAPLLLFSSAEDHVVDPVSSDHLAAASGGPVERVLLTRSYHVATLDYDQALIVERSVGFLAGLGVR